MERSSGERESQPTLEALFGALVEAKFEQGSSRAGSRAHEETLRLLPSRPLELCATATSFFLERPIPEEYQQAMETWSQYGGVRATVIEIDKQSISSAQTDFFAIGNDMYVRKSHSVPGENFAVPPRVLSEEEIVDVFDWISTAIPEP